MIAFRDRESRPKSEKDVFHDSYNSTVRDEEKTKKKFEANYLYGTLRTNIKFDDEYVKIFNKISENQ